MDIRFLRENREQVEEGLEKKKVDVDVEGILRLDERRREILKTLEPMRHRQKEAGRRIPSLSSHEKKEAIEALSKLSSKIKALEQELAEVEAKIKDQLLSIPNLPAEDVPEGAGEEDNEVLKEVGERPSFDFAPRDHVELGKQLGVIDVERSAKVAGSRFGYLLGDAVRLEFALVQHGLSLLEPEGFIPVIPPVLAKGEMIDGMVGDRFEADVDMYQLERDGLRLAATSEHTIGAMLAGEITAEASLPQKYAGFSTCFRREAGSHGKDVRGLLRVHQFDKLEMFVFCLPEQSEQMHAHLVTLQEKFVSSLGLPYRVVNVCAGELGFPAAKKVDIECWIPSEGRYRETHSCSNCTDFQARRLNIRYRREADGKVAFLHTLNGTLCAIGRTLIALMENNQRADGSVAIPEVLRPFMGGKAFLEPKQT